MLIKMERFYKIHGSKYGAAVNGRKNTFESLNKEA